MAKSRGPKKAKPGADEPSTSYRPMGASLTTEEVTAFEQEAVAQMIGISICRAELTQNVLHAQIAADRLTKVAEENWAATAQSAEKPPSFRPELVQEIYKRELGGGAASPPKLKRIMMLEISQYLEKYLWPFFDEEASSVAHIMSILVRSYHGVLGQLPEQPIAVGLPHPSRRILVCRGMAKGASCR